MIVVIPDANPPRISLVRIARVAPRLALDVARCVERYRVSPAPGSLRASSVRTILYRFVASFEHLMAQVDVTARTAVVDLGLEALRSEAIWAAFEGAAFQLYRDRRKRGSICRALQFCVSIHLGQPDLCSPGALMLRSGRTEVCRLYHVSVPFLLTYRRLLLAIDARCASAGIARYIKHRTYAILGQLMRDGAIAALLARRGFDAFSSARDQLVAAAPTICWQDSPAMRALLMEFDPGLSCCMVESI